MFFSISLYFQSRSHRYEGYLARLGRAHAQARGFESPTWNSANCTSWSGSITSQIVKSNRAAFYHSFETGNWLNKGNFTKRRAGVLMKSCSNSPTVFNTNGPR